MLDFYLSNTSNLEFPIESDYVGSISWEEFDLIREIIDFGKSNGVQFSPHSDFYIDYTHANELLMFANQLGSESTDLSVQSARLNFIHILSEGQKSKLGLYCFCD